MTAVSNTGSRRPLALTVLILLLVLLLTACSTKTDIGNNRELSETFMDHVLYDRFDDAYAMVQETVTKEDFEPYWELMQTVMEGATSYEMEQIGWQVNTSNGLTTRTTAFQVTADTGKIILLRTVTRDDISGIAGLHFSDTTAFIQTTDTYVPIVNGILLGVSILVVAFTVWMLIDCLRRKMKYKVLWAVLIFFGIAFTVTVGETSNLSFHVGLFFQTSSIAADPALVSVVTKIVVPVGAILYCCLRKKFTVDPHAPTDGGEAAQAVSDGSPTDASGKEATAETAEAEGNAGNTDFQNDR